MTTQSTRTLCPYCGVGCGLEVSLPAQCGRANGSDNQHKAIWKVRGDRAHPSSQGMVCVKGATVTESVNKARLHYPMVRDSLDEPFRRASWDEALSRVVSRIQSVGTSSGSDALCFYGSGQLLTEDYYVAQKLFKGFLGTNNFDSNSRLQKQPPTPTCCYQLPSGGRRLGQ